MIPTHNTNYKDIYRITLPRLILDKDALTEKLVCQGRIIYEAPICTCLTCFLNNNLKQMQNLTEKNIRDVISVTLTKVGVSFHANEHLYEEGNPSEINESIFLRACGTDFSDDIEQILSPDNPNCHKVVEKHSAIRGFLESLLYFERFFFSTDDEESNIFPGKDMLYNYITNLKTDPLYKELSFFHYVFNRNDYYTYNLSEDPEYYSPPSVTAREELEILKDNYIALYQTRQYYTVTDYQDICVLTLHFALQNGLTINKCHNCGQYFIPRSRSDEIYCDNPSPQNSGKTCKQYGATTLCYKREKDDPILYKCRNLLSSKQMYAKRHPDIPVYKQNYDSFKRASAEWKKRYKSGKCTAEEFDKWLDEQKERKT